MHIAEHARRRLWERFPASTPSLEILLKNKTPYGAWTIDTEVFINIEHKVVMVVAINKNIGRTVVTVLTEELYRTNFEKINHNKYKTRGIIEAVNEGTQQVISKEYKEQIKVDKEEIITLYAEVFAREQKLTYPEIKVKKAELRERFFLSSKDFEIFLQKYFAFFRKTPKND